MAQQFTATSPFKTEANAPAWRHDLVICSLLVLLVWLVFAQTLGHEFVNADDDVYVTENAHVWSGLAWHALSWPFKNLEAGFWHPLTWLSLMMDAELHGLRAGGFHLTNVLLHTANTLLLFALLRRLTAAVWRSALVAAFFAIHPLHVESVAWISERKGLLSTFFFLLSLWAYAKYVSWVRWQESGLVNRQPSKAAAHRMRWYWLALLFFACALMSKTMVVTLPAVLLLLDYWPLRRLELSNLDSPFSTFRRLLWEKVPFFGLALVTGWVTLHAERDIGALAQGESLPLTLRLANATVSSVRYLSQTVWPADLAVFYPFPSSFPIAFLGGSVALLALISLGAIWLRRRFPYLAVGWFWYLITFAPVSGLIQVGGHARADRYTYVPLVGIFLMVSWGVADLCNSWRHRRVVLSATCVAILVGLLVVARNQAAHWRDSVSLWTHSLACTPDNPEARHNLGDALAAQGKWPQAARQYERALQLKPDHVLAHDALGVALAAQGKLDEAILHFERALQLRPNFAVGHYNLGVALASKGGLVEAMQQCEEAIRLKPDYAEAHQNLAVGLATQGKLEGAKSHFEQALNLAIAQGKPELAEAIRQRLNFYRLSLPSRKGR